MSRFSYAAQYLLMALVLLCLPVVVGFGGIVPAMVGARASAIVTGPPSRYHGGPRRGRSHCMVSVSFQVAPGFAPQETLPVATRLCESIKAGDHIPVRYIRLGKETAWVAAESDGGYRLLGLAIIAIGFIVAFVVPRRRY